MRTRGLVALSALALATLAAPPPAGAGWTAPLELRASDGELIEKPIAGFTSRGELIAHTTSYLTNSARVFSRPRGGVFGPAQALAPQSWSPDLAFDRQGAAYLAWTEDGANAYAAIRPPGGPFGTPIALGEGHVGLSIAANARGDVAVLFHRYRYHPDPGRQVWAVFRPAGGAFDAPQPVSDWIPDEVNNGGADLAVAPNGQVVFLWNAIAAPDGPSFIDSAVRTPDGTIVPGPRLSRAGQSSAGPRVGMDAQGNAFAIWLERRPTDQSGAPVMANHRPAGSGWAAARVIGAANSVGGGFDLGVSDPGEVIVTYPASGTVNYWRGVPVAVIGNAATGRTGAEVPYGRTPVLQASVSMGRQGHAVLWSDNLFNPLGNEYLPAWVVRRAPFAPLGDCEVVQRGNDVSVRGAAAGPEGEAFVLTEVNREQTYSSDATGPGAPSSCTPAPPETEQPATRLRARFVRRRGRVLRGRTVEVIASCGRGCRVRATGGVGLSGVRSGLRLSTSAAKTSAAGKTRLRLRLRRRDVKALKTALRKRRRARLKVRVRARGPAVRTGSVLLTGRVRR